MAEDFDVEAMLEAPYKKGVSIFYLTISCERDFITCAYEMCFEFVRNGNRLNEFLNIGAKV